ncbi:LD-carboxypeptidase [Flavihumibacter sp. CACIAM 22H1]|uniref:S66 peptidase family protein n=1 Tax=Flavihumibacter sp. CACIAM 22H1 TaxID=1812911 RepID=UPI0007A8C0EA|nr:LD-carboxypeptidase [Flavihumibacter sp. CACIAM 22H1]KYP16532.1 MAG: LD-carboxypeptidase [Flavihumibacter sp. CACIAM 22H1]
MERTDFLKQLAALSIGTSLPYWGLSAMEEEAGYKQPPFLKQGDLIAITSPAGYITKEEIIPAVLQLESWGLRVQLGATIGKRAGSFGGTDLERAADLQNLINDPSIKAILCARGGYGLIRIIDAINFHPLRRHPKWLIGFSDVTVLHAHLFRKTGLASIHSKMCNSFPDNWQKADDLQKATILSIRDLLFGKPMQFELPSANLNRPGVGVGQLIGGNCKTIESISGSESDLHTRGKILFLEDTGEYLYSIDRMFWNIKRSGKLEHLAGLIIGGFKHKAAENPAEEFGKNLQEIVLEKLADCSYPVCFDFPVGHQKNNFALKCGAWVQLEVNAAQVRLTELNSAT